MIGFNQHTSRSSCFTTVAILRRIISGRELRTSKTRAELCWHVVVSWNLSVIQIKRGNVVANSLGHCLLPIVVDIKQKQAGTLKLHWSAFLVLKRELQLHFGDWFVGLRRRQEIELETVPQTHVVFRIRWCVLILPRQRLHHKIKHRSVRINNTNFAEPNFLRGANHWTLTTKIVHYQQVWVQIHVLVFETILGTWLRRSGSESTGAGTGGGAGTGCRSGIAILRLNPSTTSNTACTVLGPCKRVVHFHCMCTDNPEACVHMSTIVGFSTKA